MRTTYSYGGSHPYATQVMGASPAPYAWTWTRTLAYDANTGLLLSETDADNGTTTSLQYDRLGRLVRTTEAGLRTSSVAYDDLMLALATQGINATQDFLPAKGKFWAVVALSAVQGVAAVVAHFANPDGTSAEAAYIKK